MFQKLILMFLAYGAYSQFILTLLESMVKLKKIYIYDEKTI